MPTKNEVKMLIKSVLAFSLDPWNELAIDLTALTLRFYMALPMLALSCQYKLKVSPAPILFFPHPKSNNNSMLCCSLNWMLLPLTSSVQHRSLEKLQSVKDAPNYLPSLSKIKSLTYQFSFFMLIMAWTSYL